MGLRSIVRRVKARDFPSLTARKKLLRGIERIAQLDDDDLGSVDVLAEIIRGIGLRYDPRGLYGHESRYMNSTKDGLWQVPCQLAGTMALLSAQPIESFLEIGTHSGYTSTVLTAYLFRLEPRLKAITIDPFPSFRNYQAVKALLPLEYRPCTSDDLRGEAYDCVLIDGDHEYQAVKRDFENVGRHARVCLFHDINDENVGQENVPRFWRELVDSGEFDETHEFLDCAPGKRVMGIGVGIKTSGR